jgi:hypothetical protein
VGICLDRMYVDVVLECYVLGSVLSVRLVMLSLFVVVVCAVSAVRVGVCSGFFRRREAGFLRGGGGWGVAYG